MNSERAQGSLSEPSESLGTQRRIEARVHQRLFVSPPVVLRVGRFSVLEEIGRGGMGLVYAAYDELLDRKIALKLLLEDEFPSEEDRLRFRREAQALARLSHHNVVTVHEVGESEGQLFLAMEYIRGQSLAAWLRTNPPWPRVLEAFVQAGRGLQAAHAEGLVHRDFKPHNAMRTEQGGVKVLDFGLARVIAEELESVEQESSVDSALSSALTQTGAMMGTPAYMAPEQFDTTTVDARSDQYSFCVALWEGLTGMRPFMAVRHRQLLQAKVAGPPPWPREAPPVPRSIIEALRRGLAPEPGARWPSMAALLERLHQPAPPRRRRGAVRSLGWATLAVAGSWAASHYVQGKQLCTGSDAMLAGIWDDARKQEVEAALLSTALPYASTTWERVNHELDEYAEAWAQRRTEVCEATSVRGEQSAEVMDLRMRCLEERRVALRATVGVLAVADATVAANAVRLAVDTQGLSRCDDVQALQATIPPPEGPGVGREVDVLRERLATLRAELRAGRYAQALEGMELVVHRAEALGYAPLVAEAKLRRGVAREDNGLLDESEQDLLHAYELAVEHRHEEVALEALYQLTYVVGYRQSRPDEGRVWGRTTMALARRSTDPMAYATSLSHLGAVLFSQGEYAQARRHYEQALEIRQEVLGENHVKVAHVMTNLASVLSTQGHYESSKQYWHRVLQINESELGADHPDVANALNGLAAVHSSMGEYEQAKQYYERALRVAERALGPDHPDVAPILNDLGILLHLQGPQQHQQAERYHQRALWIRETALGADHPDVARSLLNMGPILSARGDHEQAARYYERALRIWEDALGPDHPYLANALTGLGYTLRARGRYEQAAASFERALQIREAARGRDHSEVSQSLRNLGDVLRSLGEHEKAEQHYQRALQIQEATLNGDHPDAARVRLALAAIALVRQDSRTARAHAERAVAICEGAEAAPPSLLAEARFMLARALWPERTERSRAHELARQARDAQRVPGHEEALAEIERWLAEHPRP